MQRLKHLVVLVPGIGGSTLVGPDGARWKLSASSLGTALVRPQSLDLVSAGRLHPIGLVRSFTTFGPLLNITGYEGFERVLHSNFRDLRVHTHQASVPAPRDTDVLLFPYDFRKSVGEAARHLANAVGQALMGIHESARRGRVIVIAHSMGGLVARYWAGVLDGWRVCKAVLTLGTPHRGAPKALDWLINGPGVGRLRHASLTRVLRGWPSMYELLPQYEAIWDASAHTAIQPDRLPEPLLKRRPQLHAYAPKFAAESRNARRVHEDIAAAWEAIPPGEAPDVIPYFGRGHPTTNLITLESDGTLSFAKKDPPWRGNVGWAGDGTVPTLSAIPRELGENRPHWRGLPDRHGALASTSGFVDLLLSYSGEPVPTRGGELPERPWLGLNLEDVVPAGQPWPLQVRVQPDENAAAGVHVRLLAVVSGLPEVFSSCLTRREDSWECLLPALPPGRYRLAVEGQRVGGPESVYCQEELVALDPQEVAPAGEDFCGDETYAPKRQ